MNEHATFRLIHITPEGKHIATEISMQRELWAKSFAPLPRDRELAFAIGSQRHALERQRLRKCLAEDLAEQIANHMLKLIEQHDPQFGYSKEEYERMIHTPHRPQP